MKINPIIKEKIIKYLFKENYANVFIEIGDFSINIEADYKKYNNIYIFDKYFIFNIILKWKVKSIKVVDLTAEKINKINKNILTDNVDQKTYLDKFFENLTEYFKKVPKIYKNKILFNE